MALASKQWVKDLLSKAKQQGKLFGKYSTEETVIGTWEDGRKVYRKCIYKTNYTIAKGNTYFEIGESVDLFLGLFAWGMLTNGNGYNLPHIHTSSISSQTAIDCINYTGASNPNTVFTNSGISREFKTLVIVVEYIKTAD